MKTINQSYIINAPVDKVWDAFVKPDIIAKWGAGPAKMDVKEGTQFSLWGGTIYGKNIQIIPHKKIMQDWYEKRWKEPSRVIFRLYGFPNKTQIDLLHENVPDSSAKDIDAGWHTYYLGAIKKYLESKH